jgi:hypothetical protein
VTFESDGTETIFVVASSPCDEVTYGTCAASRAGTALDAALADVLLPGVR